MVRLLVVLPATLESVSKLCVEAAPEVVIGIGGLLFRTIHLFFIRDVQTGLVWITKIITDPFHDVMLYWKAPLYLMKGELIDPNHGRHGGELEESLEARDA